jgi:hypothetical protein
MARGRRGITGRIRQSCTFFDWLPFDSQKRFVSFVKLLWGNSYLERLECVSNHAMRDVLHPRAAAFHATRFRHDSTTARLFRTRIGCDPYKQGIRASCSRSKAFAYILTMEVNIVLVLDDAQDVFIYTNLQLLSLLSYLICSIVPRVPTCSISARINCEDSTRVRQILLRGLKNDQGIYW